MSEKITIWLPGTLVHARPAAVEVQPTVHAVHPIQIFGGEFDPMLSASRMAMVRPNYGIETLAFSTAFSLIGSGLFSTGLAGAIGVTAFNAVVTALTYAVGFGALVGASLLLSPSGPGKQSVRDPAQQRRSYELEDGPRIIGLGRARVGGSFALRASHGGGTSTYRLLAQCQGPVDAVEEYYVKSREVTVDFDGAVSSPPYATVGGSHLYLYSKLGTADQAAFSQLLSVFPDDWSADHRLRGIASTLARFISPGLQSNDFIRVWPEGYPAFDTLKRHQFVFDPRDPAQNVNDPQTWKWSDNGVLCCLWHCTAVERNGGFGLSFAQWDLDDIALQADKADELVDSLQGAGKERRSVCSGSYTTDTPRAQVLGEIFQSTGCRVVQLQNGKMSIHLEEDNPTPTVTIRKENIIDVVWGGDELVTDANKLALLFHSPERQWQMAELEIADKDWSKDSVSIANTGERLESLNLKFCPQPGQAQRIARRVFAKRRSMRGHVITNLAGLMAMGHNNGIIELDVLEDDYHPLVEFAGIKLLEDGTKVEVSFLILETLSEWESSTHEAAAPIALEDLQFAGSIDQPEVQSARLVKTGPSTSEIRIGFSSADGATNYEATNRTWDGSISGPRLAMVEHADNRWAQTQSGVSEGDRHIIEVRGYNGDGEVGNWSEELDYVAAYDTTAPQGCSASISFNEGDSDDSPGPGKSRIWDLSASCSDLNISRIGGAYASPYSGVSLGQVSSGSHQENVNAEPTWVWDDPPSGSVTFANSTGQTTVANY